MENHENTVSTELIGYAIQLLQEMATELNQPHLPLSEVDRIIDAVSQVVPGWEALLADIQSASRSENASNQVPKPLVLKEEDSSVADSVAVLLNTILAQLEAYKQLVVQVADCPRTPPLENLLTKLTEQGSDSLQRLRSFMETSAAGGQAMSNVELAVQESCVVEEKISVGQDPEAATPTISGRIKAAGATRRSAVARPRVVLDDVLDHAVPKTKKDQKVQLGFVCDLCRKRYTSKQNLEGHMNSVHLKVKPFACRVCNQRFSIRAAQNRHQQRHFWMFNCDMCNNRYKLKAHLLQHKAKRH
ncbi:hypothetical protein pipiens_014085 [Culex pipiens pipiens]|uniref:C2H2-type domain-containing protein n=1 Tax=Culex pipiens pipiens TaxID=38569 RepID=A0ABD1CWZ8_CULPP